ncbi:ribonucleoside-diphosphate reductase subunit alpha [bacterium]|nr:ribonucleoside-diphosphate reductase subunit alpha [bacterium]
MSENLINDQNQPFTEGKTDYIDSLLENVTNGVEGVHAKELGDKIKQGLTGKMEDRELDELAAETAIAMCTKHYNYNIVATKIVIARLYSIVQTSFSESMELLEELDVLHPEFITFVRENRIALDIYIKSERDFELDYFGFKTLEKSYLQRTKGVIVETPQYLFMRVACAIHRPNLENVFNVYDDLSKKYYIHATPTLFNAGMKFQQLSSCYLVAMQDDSITGIYDTLKECAQISKWAGGIGVHIHQIRGKNSKIKSNNGTSDGIVPMLRVFNDTARYCNQAGKRPGSFAVYLEPWHSDVEAFLDLKKNHGNEEERARDLFYALWIPDLFMKQVGSDGDWYLMTPNDSVGLSDVYGKDFEDLYWKYVEENKYTKKMKARELWTRILYSQIETGVPYMLYKDACNQKSNQKNLGTIKSSNLCVAPETYILTDKGQIQIQNLVNKEINVWNGDKWSTTKVLQTGTQQKLITVHLSNGSQITCTPYHKFLVQQGYTHKKNQKSIKDAKRMDASQLTKGMKLIKFNLEVVQGDKANDIPHAYTHGFFCGDGTYHHNHSGYVTKGLSLYGEKKDLIPYLKIRSSSLKEDALGRINTMLPDEISDKYVVPLNSSIKCRLEWLAGLLDADGTVAQNGTNESFQIGSIHFEFLDRVRLMLQTLGVQSKVMLSHGERKTLMPDGKGGRKEYDCKPLWRILISSSALYSLNELGLLCHRLKFKGNKPQRNAEQFVTVISVADDGRIDDTYCFNEPENHAGVFNGILTSNCTEIIQYSDKDETAVCNLASIGLPMYLTREKSFNHELLGQKVRQIVRNLNRVIDINFYPTENSHRSNMRHRPIGIGVQGLADVFMELGLDWESEPARKLNRDIFETIYYYSISESCELAKLEKPYQSYQGSPISEGKFQFDLWKNLGIGHSSMYNWEVLRQTVLEHGVRNSLMVAPMPTASTSQILGFNETIEPVTSNIYSRRTLAGSFMLVNKRLMQDCMKLGIWSESLKNEIITNDGSIQEIESIPKSLRDIYKTVWDIKQKVLINLACDRGRYICQSQSLNLYLSKIDMNTLGSMHLYGWIQGLKTGLYYLRIKPVAKTQQFTVEPKAASAVVKVEEKEQKEEKEIVCRREAGCTTCSS